MQLIILKSTIYFIRFCNLHATLMKVVHIINVEPLRNFIGHVKSGIRYKC
jgi:hypothetical protein